MSLPRLASGFGIPLAAAVATLALSGAFGAQTTQAETASSTPVISNIAASSTANGTGATVTWSTDIPASTQVQYGTTTSYGIFSELTGSTTGSTTHSVTLANLSPGTLYHYSVRSMGTGSTTATTTVASSDQTFTTASSSTATTTATTTTPVLSNVTASTTPTGATITWTTDVPSTMQVLYGTTTAYGASTTLDSTLMTTHSVTLSGLTPNTTYHYQALSGNSSGTGTSTDKTLTTASTTSTTTPATTTIPVISAINATPAQTGATVTWTTDVPATGQIAYGTTTNNYFASTTVNNATTTSHTQELTGLTAGLTYHFQIMSGNSAGMATSADRSFTTLAQSTSTATTTLPVISGINVTPTTNGATITWTTDVGASGQISYGPTAAYNATSTGHTSLMTSHSETLSGLSANTLYHFQIRTANSAGTSMSTDRTFTTLATSTATTTPDTSGDIAGLKDRVSALESRISGFEARIAALENQIANILSRLGGSSGTTTPSTSGQAFVEQNGQTFSAGGVIDFAGRNFGREQQVTILLNGATVATAHADGGGNFTTGSLRVPTNPGTYTYSFNQTGGTNTQATITVR